MLDRQGGGRPHGRLDTSRAHFRSLRKTSASQRDKATASVEQIWELVHALERHVHLPEINLPDSFRDDEASDTPVDPAGAARVLRRHWQLGDGPVQHLVRRIEANGIVVVTPHRDTGLQAVDAFSTWQFSRPIIVLTPQPRRRCLPAPVHGRSRVGTSRFARHRHR
jgi:hypothetical protein